MNKLLWYKGNIQKDDDDDDDDDNELENSRRNFFVTRDLDLWPLDPKINVSPGLIVEHFYVMFGDPSCVVFQMSCGKKQTHAQTNEGKNPTPRLPSASVI